jgi:hypothetical protein
MMMLWCEVSFVVRRRSKEEGRANRRKRGLRSRGFLFMFSFELTVPLIVEGYHDRPFVQSRRSRPYCKQRKDDMKYTHQNHIVNYPSSVFFLSNRLASSFRAFLVRKPVRQQHRRKQTPEVECDADPGRDDPHPHRSLGTADVYVCWIGVWGGGWVDDSPVERGGRKMRWEIGKEEGGV